MADRELRAAVAVLGGGPAGCATALTLRRYVPELPVVMITAPGGDAPGVGETLSPGVLPLLRYLGVDAEFRSAGHLPAGGTASAWGSGELVDRSYLFTGRGLGWHLDRRGFDEWLLARTRAAGARVIEGRARMRDAARMRGRWTFGVSGGESVVADAIVDATGRSALLARRAAGERPRRDDALVAQVRWYASEREQQRVAAGALVESVADGWWYSAALPGRRGVAMFMTDSDLRGRAGWDERLGRAPATARRLARWEATGRTAMRAASSQFSPAAAGDGFVAAGDAAAAFDPISALGIGFSLRSGMEAARVAAAAAEGDGAPAAAYSQSLGRIYADYRSRFRALYSQEARWPEAPFWARRRAVRGGA